LRSLLAVALVAMKNADGHGAPTGWHLSALVVAENVLPTTQGVH
jgi:hypothetical protein